MGIIWLLGMVGSCGLEKKMRSVVVMRSELGRNWRAEAHAEAKPEKIKEARKMGGKCGLRGIQTPPKCWMNHGNPKVEKAFQDAYIAALKVHKEFLEKLEVTT